jgi:hypothetical protein
MTMAAADGFRESLGPLIVGPLTRIEAYAELIEGYEAAGLLGGRFEQWLGLDPAGKVAFAEEVGEDPGDIAREIAADVKPRNQIAYQVVFQKGFIGAIVEMDRQRDALSEAWGLAADADRETVVGEWVDRFNRVFGPHLGGSAAWNGAGVSAAGTINWTQASQRAITGFIVYGLIAPLEEWKSDDEDEVFSAAREWLEQAWAQSGAGRPATPIARLYKQGAAWKRFVTTYVRQVFRAREAELPPEDSDFLDQGARQLAELVRALS